MNKEYKLILTTSGDNVGIQMQRENKEEWVTPDWSEHTKEDLDKYISLAESFIKFINRFR